MLTRHNNSESEIKSMNKCIILQTACKKGQATFEWCNLISWPGSVVKRQVKSNNFVWLIFSAFCAIHVWCVEYGFLVWHSSHHVVCSLVASGIWCLANSKWLSLCAGWLTVILKFSILFVSLISHCIFLYFMFHHICVKIWLFFCLKNQRQKLNDARNPCIHHQAI